jgi:ATP-dependent RNA helicase RhlB
MPARTTRQTLLFSATLSHRVLELAYEHMNEPEKLVVETESITAARVRQTVYFPANEEKLPLLLGLLSRSEGARTMVFVNTKVFVERVARALEKAGYRVGVLSGDVPQKKRESLLRRFQAGQLEILVATDVAARGLHIDGVKYVYNYDLPFDAEDYVHRIGRTARLGEEGDAISFACEMYAMGLPDIEAFIEQKIPVGQVTPELMTALPRPERAVPAASADEEEEEDSISEIFREVREQKAAEKAGARDGGTGSRRRSERSAGSGPRPAPGGERKDRPAREDGGRQRSRQRPAREDEAQAPSPAQANGGAAPELAPSGAPEHAAATEGSGANKRRRRGGRRQREARERVEARLLHGDRVASPSAPAAGAEASPESLLARLKKRVSRFFNRPPARH